MTPPLPFDRLRKRYVSNAELTRLARLQREKAEERKAKRSAKRADLPWGKAEPTTGAQVRFPWMKRRKRQRSEWDLWLGADGKCDKAWSAVILRRDRVRFGPVCRIGRAQGCTGRAECAYHIKSKAAGRAIRWLLENGVAACAPCNRGEMLNRDKYRAHHVQLFGQAHMDLLDAAARQVYQPTVEDGKALHARLLALLASPTLGRGDCKWA